ncbi:hypothetical protein IY145_10855 [Methylosinus sp. H3A]|uniref:hypothetical protein n=1 Tax=Methylosinus sp. H3A TaxID=2785786 RepID=UPI0018C27121|nr:hypothetical protein [Methylosinus sp. H3A]MBG0809878.1 hypothetical protein [Methylosinus sp. H3A]
MSTIAKDYAAELRRISSYLGQIGHFDDTDELRLAAEYLEQREKGVALEAEEIEERMSKADLGLADGWTRSLFEHLQMTIATQRQIEGGDSNMFLDFMVTGYMMAAATVAVSSLRTKGPVSSQDFLATASDIWFASLLEDAVAEAGEGDAA